LRLIAGLGNPGERYKNTRHNVGFRVVDELARRYNVRLKKKLFSNTKEARAVSSDINAVLIEPQTFMNLSGGALLRYYHKLNIAPNELLVVCDDINLALGTIRIRPQGSAGGHNGLESVIKSLKSEDFARLRIGIKTEEAFSDLAEYVLSDFKKSQWAKAEEAINLAADAVEFWLKEDIEKVMTRFN
jgi:PTH1 family peptidyl-tRNA hydrolase